MIAGERRFFAYDTLCRISLEAETREKADALLDQGQKLALEVEATLSMYDPASELSRLCAGYVPGRDYPISPMLADFLALNLMFCRRTKGAFDPTVGPLIRLWDFLAADPRVPSQEEIAEARKRVGYEHIHLDAARSSVRLDVPGIVLDPGASGKGYALGLVASLLQREGIQNAVIDFGGNLYLIGGRQDSEGGGEADKPWRIALIDPEDTDTYIGAVAMQDMGIATSSWYEHSFRKDGRIYHHLLDPFTGEPKPLTLQSVSILSSNGAYTDFLSTAFFMLGLESGVKLAEELARESGEFIGYVAVTEAHEIITSGNVEFTPKK